MWKCTTLAAFAHISLHYGLNSIKSAIEEFGELATNILANLEQNKASLWFAPFANKERDKDGGFCDRRSDDILLISLAQTLEVNGHY